MCMCVVWVFGVCAVWDTMTEVCTCSGKTLGFYDPGLMSPVCREITCTSISIHKLFQMFAGPCVTSPRAPIGVILHASHTTYENPTWACATLHCVFDGAVHVCTVCVHFCVCCVLYALCVLFVSCVHCTCVCACVRVCVVVYVHVLCTVYGECYSTCMCMCSVQCCV